MTQLDKHALDHISRIHFIGIGGSGMFPLAQILNKEGFQLTGSDNNESDTLDLVRGMGIPVHLGHDAKNIEGAQMVVYTAAIPADNPELLAAKAAGIPTVERAGMLGLISRRYRRSVCVSGTHGKTTCSSMTAKILMDAGADPSAVIGGKLKAIGGSGRVGNSDIFVCEACEFKDTFLSLHSDIGVILNIDEDHLDYFGTLDNIIKSFRTFAENNTGPIIFDGDDKNTRRALADLSKRLISFGFGEGNAFRAVNPQVDGHMRYRYELVVGGKNMGEIVLGVPGMHNILNSLAAIAAAVELGVSIEVCRDSLAGFTGAGRRFEILGTIDGITIADDYAHHPAELKATLETAMNMGYDQVFAVFQPFTYSRTKILFDDFVKVLSIPDRLVMSEIMGGREENTYGIYTADLAEKLPGSVWFPTFDEIADYVLKEAKPGDLVITLGCGDIYKAAKKMFQKAQEAGRDVKR